MAEIIADKCDGCGKVVIKNWHGNSSDMVHAMNCDYLLFMGDIRGEEIARPTFPLNGKVFCPQCLEDAIHDWINKLKKRPPSTAIDVR